MGKLQTLAFGAAAVSVMCAGIIGGTVLRTQADIKQVSQSGTIKLGNVAGIQKEGLELSESEYFFQLAELIQRNYVEPIEIDQAMASGAIRGAIGSLLDPESQFFSKEAFASYQKMLRGEYEGIGVDLRFLYDEKELGKLREKSRDTDTLLLLPVIEVSAVMPNSPANKAGIEAGDRILKVNDKWIVTGEDIRKLRDMQTQVTEKKLDASELTKFRDILQERVKSNIPGGKVREKLMVGTEGTVKLTWIRDGKEMSADVGKANLKVPAVTENEVRFFGDSNLEASKLPETIDLRNSGPGDLDTMTRLLTDLLPSGVYGQIVREKGDAKDFSLEGRGTGEKRFRLMTDSSTTGVSAIFAHALVGAGLATIEGKLPPDPKWIQVQRMPDGSGYTLNTGIFRAKTAVSKNETAEVIR